MAIPFTEEAKRRNKEHGCALFKFSLDMATGRIEASMALDKAEEKAFLRLWTKWNKAKAAAKAERAKDA